MTDPVLSAQSRYTLWEFGISKKDGISLCVTLPHTLDFQKMRHVDRSKYCQLKTTALLRRLRAHHCTSIAASTIFHHEGRSCACR